MTTLFGLLLSASGMSTKEAADFLDVRHDTVKSWSSGRNRTPEGVIGTMASLVAKIQDVAGRAMEQVDLAAENQSGPGVIELGLASDDHEAQSIGWPTASAQARSIALTAADLLREGHEVKIVPRGSTPGTAAAADAHETDSR